MRAAHRTSKPARAQAVLVLGLGILSMMFAAVPYAPSTGSRSIDEIIFSPAAALFAVVGMGFSIIAARMGVRIRRSADRSSRSFVLATIGLVFGVLGAVAGLGAFWF